MSKEENCNDKDLRTNYDDCERVDIAHKITAIILIIATIATSVFIHWVSQLMWKNRELTLIRFRGPLMIQLWAISAHLYGLSRILYAGIVIGLYPWRHSLDVVIYCIRGIGQNGMVFLYIMRGFMFFQTYRYDEEISKLNSDPTKLVMSKRSAEVMRSHAESIVGHSNGPASGNDNGDDQCCCHLWNRFVNWIGYLCCGISPNALAWPIRYKNTLGKETWLIKCVVFYGVCYTVTLTVLRAIGRQHTDYVSQFFLGVNFVLVFVLGVRLSYMRDRLGLVREYLLFFLFCFTAAVVGQIILAFSVHTEKRLLSWAGALSLNAIGIGLTFYIPFIRYNELRNIQEHQKLENEGLDSRKNKKSKILARILIDEEGIDLFNRFLKGIYCQENLHFFIIVAIYKRKVQRLNESKKKAAEPKIKHAESCPPAMMEMKHTMKDENKKEVIKFDPIHEDVVVLDQMDTLIQLREFTPEQDTTPSTKKIHEKLTVDTEATNEHSTPHSQRPSVSKRLSLTGGTTVEPSYEALGDASPDGVAADGDHSIDMIPPSKPILSATMSVESAKSHTPKKKDDGRKTQPMKSLKLSKSQSAKPGIDAINENNSGDVTSDEDEYEDGPMKPTKRAISLDSHSIRKPNMLKMRDATSSPTSRMTAAAGNLFRDTKTFQTFIKSAATVIESGLTTLEATSGLEKDDHLKKDPLLKIMRRVDSLVGDEDAKTSTPQTTSQALDHLQTVDSASSLVNNKQHMQGSDTPLNDSKRSKTLPSDIHSKLVIDIELFDFPEELNPHPELMDLPLEEWPVWIYQNYVTNSGPFSVNTRQNKRDDVKRMIEEAIICTIPQPKLMDSIIEMDEEDLGDALEGLSPVDPGSPTTESTTIKSGMMMMSQHTSVSAVSRAGESTTVTHSHRRVKPPPPPKRKMPEKRPSMLMKMSRTVSALSLTKSEVTSGSGINLETYMNNSHYRQRFNSNPPTIQSLALSKRPSVAMSRSVRHLDVARTSVGIGGASLDPSKSIEEVTMISQISEINDESTIRIRTETMEELSDHKLSGLKAIDLTKKTSTTTTLPLKASDGSEVQSQKSLDVNDSPLKPPKSVTSPMSGSDLHSKTGTLTGGLAGLFGLRQPSASVSHANSHIRADTFGSGSGFSLGSMKQMSMLQIDINAEIDVCLLGRVFDAIQKETWQLMLRDSLTHFMDTQSFDQWKQFQRFME